MKKRRERRISSINVIPYLDVMLVLLVIFMITAPLFNLGTVEPARVAGKSASPGASGILVEYQLGGALAVLDPQSGDKKILTDVDAVVDRLNTECILNPARPVVVVGDREQSHQDVMDLYFRIVSDSGCKHVGLGVQTE